MNPTPQLCAAPALARKPRARKPKAPKGPLDTANCDGSLKAFANGENFDDVLTLSYLFYEAQQSGKLPDWNRMRADKPCGWRHDAHLNEGKSFGKDLVGGYYDAGGECVALRCC